MSLSGKTVIVTGGASGIGAVYSAALVREGAVVYIADITDGTSLEAELSQGEPGRAIFVRTDVGDEESVRALVGTVITEHGRIDVLINNAALFATLEPTPYDQIDLALWDRVMRVNLAGAFLLCKHVGPHMAARGAGRIVNIGSGTSIKGHPGMLHYAASKGAITALTRTLARELGEHGVVVNMLSPGFTLSDTVVKDNPGLVDVARAGVATRSIHRDMYPDDLVGALLFLASEASGGFLTGQTLLVDGGQLNT
ncbi:SDR family NAD(P)-dependent oxidoreductase [Pseudonocardia xinjiangensis]|uniref:SDR family oxidoreductase n=1 Tax=Pseudonocardia xinjiangensis TaxID=75289 RepID=A0ABX1REH6_9PSEU|nr:SDR family NAD(P)-dependent oxidoreductase [Pseudonocardia xinjiangensis]NMH77794.1 SDR family oxidoreductase [Pseudonocardia xinjiangensis]